jgi:hypothetical protein
MARLQQSHVFGVSSQIVTETATVEATERDPYLLIKLTDFSILDLSMGTPSALSIFAAMLIRGSGFFSIAENLDDENNNVVITKNWKALFDRNTDDGLIRKIGIRYAVDCYEIDPSNDDINPNNLF